MDRFKIYAIPFAGMAKGNHRFEYEIGDTFFELFDRTVTTDTHVHVDLDFLKSEQSLTLTFRIHGSMTLSCDRCLGPVNVPVDQTNILLVRFGEPGVGETDDTIVISHDDHQINIAQHIYDYISLSVPMRVIHPDKADGTPGCDPEFLKRLLDSAPEHHNDPRWEVLKKLGLN